METFSNHFIYWNVRSHCCSRFAKRVYGIRYLTSVGLTKRSLRNMMKQKKVKFASADEAKEFVSIASGCDFDVNVFYNRMIIDAKSLLGVLSLDLTKILTVEFDGENTLFEEFLERKNPMHAVA